MLLKQFQPTLWSSIAASLLFALLITLGFWQLHRYHYKEDLLQAYHSAANEQPLTLAKLGSRADRAFQHLTLQGAYLNAKTILLDGRWHDHKLGYEVLTPVKIQGQDKAVLVNRGWVLAPPARQQLPQIAPAKSVQNILGYVKLISSNVFILGDNIAEPTHWPLRIQKVDIQQLQKLMGLDLYPFVLRLDAAQPNGFIRQWKIVNVMPERHLGYAVQWFAMALALLIAFVAFSWRREKV